LTVSHRRPEAMIKITITLPVIPDTVVYATTSDEATCRIARLGCNDLSLENEAL